MRDRAPRDTSVISSICWLGEPECHDHALVGGKAAQLSRLAAAFRVPPGFCLPTTALDEGEPLAEDLPETLLEAVKRAYALLADRCGMAEPPVAVRSSAIDEDGDTASFAGQHETMLNVVGAEAVARAAVRCWASASNARVRAYRVQQGLAPGHMQMAVLVQQLVAADCSAVVFTADPVSSSRDTIVINANWGLGESIVGGTVIPDTYVVRASDLTLISRRIAEKSRMTISVAGGTCEVVVPRFLRTQPALTDDQVVELSQLGVALEAALGRPVDVECAYQAGQVYLLQCRPITALP